MSKSKPSLLRRQLNGVSNRLFLQGLLNVLTGCLAGGLLLSAVWLLVEPLLFEAAGPTLRWSVVGTVLLASAALALVLAVLRAPTSLDAALELDEKFGLKERVTTSLTLTPEQAATPAGAALLEDVSRCLNGLDVGSRFPVQLTWVASLVPAAGLVLALVALFYDPARGQAPVPPEEQKLAAADAAAIEQQMKNLEKKVRQPRPEDPRVSRKLQEIEEELDKIASKPRTNQEDARERLKDLTALEEDLQKYEKELAKKQDEVKEQLKQLDRLEKKKANSQTKELDKALAEGDFDKARAEADRLAKKLKDKELTDAQKDELLRDLGELQDRLERLSRRQEEEDRLRELSKKGELDPEALDRELDRIKKSEEHLQQLRDLAEQLEKCEKCLQDGDGEKAAEELEKLSEMLKKCEEQGMEREEIEEHLRKIRECKSAICKACEKGGAGTRPGNKPGGKPGGARTSTKDGDSKSFVTRSRGQDDPNGQLDVVGYAPGRSFKKKSTAEIATEVKQASQAAPEAIERQRYPKGASDIAKGYFENLGGEKERAKDAKAP